jgi:nitrite reductase (NADH) large subunit
MEGGMSYLKAVVVDDVLGIAAELEDDMQKLIDVYQCEWKEVVRNPELRKRFSHFVNAPVKDPSIAFETMRDQKRAKEWA